MTTTTTTTLPAKRRLGRPTKFNADTVAKICDSIAEGLPFHYAAALAGISHETFSAWQRRYPHFRQAIQEAVAHGAEERLKIIRTAAKGGDWRACAWWLEHVLPEHYAKTRIQLEHVGQMEVGFTIPQQTLDGIAEARMKYEQAQGK